MNLKTQRNILAIALVILLVLLGVLVGTGGLTGAAGAGGGVKFDTATGAWVITSDENQTVNPLNPGQSVVGLDTFIPGLNIHKSGGDEGNNVIYITENIGNDVAYGGNAAVNGQILENMANGCSIPGGAIADVGDPAQNYRWNSKKHDYTFTFAEGKSANKFSIGVLDWGDFMQWQAQTAPGAHGVHTIQMFGYDANGQVVASTEYTFETDPQTTTGAPKYLRPSPQFPNYTPTYTGALEKWGVGLKKAGDACEAQEGQPGNLILTVQGTGIVRVQVKFKDNNSMDPHIALWLGALDIEFECTEDCEEAACYNFLALSEDTRKSFDFSGTAGVTFCGGGVWSNSGAESSNNSVPSYDETCDMPLFTSAGDWIKPENLTGAGYTVSDPTSVEPDPQVLADPILAKGWAPTKPATCLDAIDVKRGETLDIIVDGPTCYENIQSAPGSTLTITGAAGRSDNILYIANSSGAPAKVEGVVSANNVFIYTEGEFHVNAQSGSVWTPMLDGGALHGFMLWVAGAQFTLNGGSDSSFTGTIYAPDAPAKINGDSNTILKVTLIADTIDFAGTNTTKTYCVPELNYVTIP